MSRAVLNVELLLFILSVIAQARYLVQLLPERAAEGDIHFLEAPTHCQHRQAGGDRGGNQR